MSKPAVELALNPTGSPRVPAQLSSSKLTRSSPQERLFLLEHVTGKATPQLIVEKTCLTPEEEVRFKELLEARESGIPVQILTGKAFFMDFEVSVQPWVFIPRPETEQLVAKTLEELSLTPQVILELGTGTGAISIALARRFPSATLAAVDLSPIALNLARHNAEELGLSDRIQFIRANLFGFKEASGFEGKIDLLISNPPYIPTAQLCSLPNEVRLFDPPLALDGGPDGFSVVERILDSTQRFLSPRGLLALEIDPLLEEPLDKYVESSPLRFKKGVDSYGNLRFLFVRRT